MYSTVSARPLATLVGGYWLRAAVFLPVWHPRSCINEYHEVSAAYWGKKEIPG